MVRIEELAEAVLQGDSLRTRSLAQDFLRENEKLTEVAQPAAMNHEVMVISAALLELFASRLQQVPPDWTQDVGALPEPIFLVKAATTMRRLRQLCELESPMPLRKRGLYAPPNYLEFA
jgi:hypothetical protein